MCAKPKCFNKYDEGCTYMYVGAFYQMKEGSWSTRAVSPELFTPVKCAQRKELYGR